MKISRFRVHLHSAPGMWTFYEGHVDIWAKGAGEAFAEAVRELERTSFKDRRSLDSWRLERVEPL